MNVLHLLSGGAAQGVVARLQPSFESDHDVVLDGAFGAVGVMKQRLLAGDACDVAILTAALIDELTASGLLVPASSRPLGRVRTGIAVRSGESMPDVASRASLSAALLAADGIYFPDPLRATAGIHFMDVLKRLGIEADVASKLHPFPNGAAAMSALARTAGPRLIGCTQITEIRYTAGVTLVAPLPDEFELATVYTAAVCTRTSDPVGAQRLVELLGGPASARVRADGGFELQGG